MDRYGLFITQVYALNRARGFASKNLHKNLDLKHIYFFNTFTKFSKVYF
jgi:hypothetical protein